MKLLGIDDEILKAVQAARGLVTGAGLLGAANLPQPSQGKVTAGERMKDKIDRVDPAVGRETQRLGPAEHLFQVDRKNPTALLYLLDGEGRRTFAKKIENLLDHRIHTTAGK